MTNPRSVCLNITFNIAGYWRVANGRGQGAHLDAVVLKCEENNLPYIPGRSVKGLLRDAYRQTYDLLNSSDMDHPDDLFGTADKAGNEVVSVFVSNAEMAQNWADYVVENGFQDGLYDVLYSTAMTKDGVAKDKSLRTEEVCVPIMLVSEIELQNVDALKGETLKYLKKSLGLIRNFGADRNRGLGRVKVTCADGV